MSASPAELLGRRACPLCDFGAAHVKRRDGKLPFVHCPQCGTVLSAKSGHQADLMLRSMRPTAGHADAPAERSEPLPKLQPIAAVSAPAEQAAPSIAPAPARRPSLWESLAGVRHAAAA